jgi:hypothetical protein
MALFGRSKIAAVGTSQEPEIKAAVGYGRGSNAGASQINNFYAYTNGEMRQIAMRVPTISRARDLMASVIGCLKLEMFRDIWNGEEMEPVPLAPRAWLSRIDPSVTNNFILSWTFDDLFFYGRAFWYIKSRTADGYPSSYERLPAAMVTTMDQAGPVWFSPSNQVLFSGLPIESENLVQFLSPVQGLLYTSSEAITTALRLEDSARRNAESAIPAGVLRQISGEPLSGQELADMASAFNLARMTNQTAALNECLTYEATTATPDKMLLVESRDFQARELCRAANIPNYLAGIDQGSYQYTTSQGAREDLYLFGAKAFIDCISETLSSDNVLPHGTYVKFDVASYLSESYLNEIDVDVETPMPSPTRNPMDTPEDVLND